jgi:hypothetical protein
VALPKPTGADDEADASYRGQLGIQPRIQPLDQARVRYQFGPDGGDVEFCYQEGINLLLPPSASSINTVCLDRAPSAQFYPVPPTRASRCVRMVARWSRMLGNDGVAPEMGRVVVASVQRMSDDRPLAASNPFASSADAAATQRSLQRVQRRWITAALQ